MNIYRIMKTDTKNMQTSTFIKIESCYLFLSTSVNLRLVNLDSTFCIFIWHQSSERLHEDKDGGDSSIVTHPTVGCLCELLITLLIQLKGRQTQHYYRHTQQAAINSHATQIRERHLIRQLKVRRRPPPQIRGLSKLLAHAIHLIIKSCR